ncbi:MAG: hypothetical protein PHG92_04860, partial [Patescibacteria group bacterium]|nr:hypothetical protein [Patescibacteria group bacterium]
FKYLIKNKKILLPILAIVSLIAGIFLSLYSSVIFQEGNPWPQIKGMVQLKFDDSDIVKLSGSDNRFMTESKNGTMIHDFMKTKGYEFTEQMGSGYFFKSTTGQTAIATHRYYSRYYSLWTITEDNNDSNNNLWTTITNDRGVTFQYPKELLAKYVSVVEWPPVIAIETSAYSCKNTPQEVSSMSDITSERMVDNRTYCLNVKNEGAAGSVYSSYVYTTVRGGKLVKVSFTLRYPNCNNYDEEQSKACASEREAFDVDSTVDRIVQTIELDLLQNESLSDQIRKCIVMSDTASHEKCNQLLKQITDYNSCVRAGFSIMKSSPPQCATLDGRNFTDETNSDWNIVLAALKNCEVERVFQTHSKLVILKLKNGDKVSAYEPQIDDVMKVVESLNGKCGNIIMATE